MLCCIHGRLHLISILTLHVIWYVGARAEIVFTHTNHDETHDNSLAKPSFLYMLIDDVGWADFSYNNGTALTPNIDRWAARSLILQDMHSGGTVCSPTRATVLTGRNHFRDCVDNVYGCNDMSTCVPAFEFAPSKTFTVGDAIVAAGDDYANGGAFFAGKWHLGSFYNDSESYGGRTSSPITHGFHHFNATTACAPTYSLNCQCKAEWEATCRFGHYNDIFHFCESPHGDPNHCCFNYWWDDPFGAHGVTNTTEAPTEPDDALYLVDAFSRFLHERQSQQLPFFAQISFHNCHIPFIGSDEAVESCKRNETCRTPVDKPYTAEELDFYACLTQLDTAVGHILALLESTGYFANTMIWMSSDNGTEHNCPPHGICQHGDSDPRRPLEGPGSAGLLRGRKRDIYEGGHRVPGVVSWPAFAAWKNGAPSGESWETVSTMDFLPTIMDILNVSRPASQQDWAMDGRSILPLLRGQRWSDTALGERQIGFGFWDPRLTLVNGWGFRYGEWKYVHGSRSCSVKECRQPQLYNLEMDMGERQDLAKERPDILHDLQRRFQMWHKSIMHSRRSESHCQTVDSLAIVFTDKDDAASN
jgi:arylsulfatase A-like enzyme